jgi:hypothetical protein
VGHFGSSFGNCLAEQFLEYRFGPFFSSPKWTEHQQLKHRQSARGILRDPPGVRLLGAKPKLQKRCYTNQHYYFKPKYFIKNVMD